jgi:hypothetical protein
MMSNSDHLDRSSHPPMPRSVSPAVLVLAGAGVVGLMLVGVTLGGREVYFGSQNLSFIDEGVSARVLARRAMELKIAGRVPESELRAIVDRLRAKAGEGDPKAALFVFELAKAQAEEERGAGTKPATPNTTAAP